jgi:ApaG protein
MSDEVTDGIRIQVQSFFVPAKSDPDEGRWFFAYRVTITNEGTEPARLVSRHWIISDGHGRLEEVRGPGVVGETPRLEPGEAFQYTSFCPLPTPTGAMKGSYRMVRDDGRAFDARIGAFSLMTAAQLN